MKLLSIQKKSLVPSSGIEGEIDIDVKPMMNVLLILIPFLVSVAVYTRLAVIDMSLPPNVTAIAPAASSAKPSLKLTVVIAPNFVAITYGASALDSLERTSDSLHIGPLKKRDALQKTDYAYNDLLNRLKERRTSVSAQDEIIVAPYDGIAFQYVVNIMDICKKAGFTKVSLASAAQPATN
jgi:biopolymer transport protein ExbD